MPERVLLQRRFLGITIGQRRLDTSAQVPVIGNPRTNMDDPKEGFPTSDRRVIIGNIEQYRVGTAIAEYTGDRRTKFLNVTMMYPNTDWDYSGKLYAVNEDHDHGKHKGKENFFRVSGNDIASRRIVLVTAKKPL